MVVFYHLYPVRLRSLSSSVHLPDIPNHIRKSLRHCPSDFSKCQTVLVIIGIRGSHAVSCHSPFRQVAIGIIAVVYHFPVFIGDSGQFRRAVIGVLQGKFVSSPHFDCKGRLIPSTVIGIVLDHIFVLRQFGGLFRYLTGHIVIEK